ncbi:MAG: hypothetical protein A2Y12_02420 [Planctomycetes bacterium GWF2_42_9]|nr:MAG: hypothetical protein A2Y12_02420 [Planctomycetes bacterium GWF2_42_9]
MLELNVIRLVFMNGNIKLTFVMLMFLPIFAASTCWAAIGNLVTSFSDGYSRLKTAEISVSTCGGEAVVHNYELVTLAGEYQAAGLRLTNCGGTDVTCNISLTGLDESTFTYVVQKQEFLKTYYYQSSNNKISDPLCLLPRNGQNYVVTVPANTRIKLYIGIHVLAAATGINNAILTVQTPDGSEQLNLTFNVLSAAAPTASRYYYAAFMWPWLSVSASSPDLAAMDLRSHGTTMMEFPSLYATFTTAGDIVSVNYSVLDRRLLNYGPAVGKLLLFWEGQYTQFTTNVGTYLTPYSTSWDNAFKNYLRAWLTHASQLGFGVDRFAITPIDEAHSTSFAAAPNDEVTNFIHVANLVNDVNSNLTIALTLTDYAGITDLNAMLPYVDIVLPVWPYRTSTLAGQTTGYKPRMAYYSTLLPALKAWRNAASGREIWSYHIGGGSSDPELLGNRAYPVLMVGEGTGDGLTGAAHYAYNCSGGSSWDNTDQGLAPDYSLIYDGTENQASNLAFNPTRARLVPSIRWEGLRAGLQDARILLYLKEVKSQQVTAVQTQIQALLDEAASMASDVALKWDGGITQPNDVVLYSGWVTADYMFDYARRIRLLYMSVNPHLCSHPIQGDTNRDCKINFGDLARLISEWMSCNLSTSQLCN